MFGKLTVILIVAGLLTFTQSYTAFSADSEELQNLIAENHRAYMPSEIGLFPTVVVIPGCSGIALESSEAEAAITLLTEDDLLFRAHYPRFAKRLSDEGFAVYLIDILTSEGLITACGDSVPAQRIAQYIDAAIAWVKTRPRVDASDLHIIGFSMGGKGTLAWLHGARNEVSPVRSVTTVYPQCRDRKPMNIAVPVLMLLGDADDIADPMVCEALVDSSPIKGLITVRHYPGARHGFDIQGAPSVIDIGNGMTVGYQEAAANGAWKELTAFIGDNP
jgi:dienelactone hydrolase